MIHVNRGTTSLGVFSEQEIREGLSAGRFAPTDIGWREGMATWQPLSQFPEFGGTAAPAVPPVQPGAAPTSTTVAGRTWFAVGAPARARLLQRVHRNAVNGAYSSSRSIQCDEARRRLGRAAHLRAHRWIRGRDRVGSVLARFPIHRTVCG